MKLLLALTRSGPEALQRSLPEGRLVAPTLLPRGFDPRAALSALLGQDPRTTWTGPAPWGLAAARVLLAEDETGYLLSPVRVEDGVVVEEVRLGAGRLREMVDWLAEELVGEAVQVVAGDPPLLVVAEPHVGPSTLVAERLAGRPVGDLAAGPPAVLHHVVEGSQLGCLEIGGRATHLFPHTPGGPSRVRPLRETWLGLGPGAVVGASPDAAALAELLRLRRMPAQRGAELDEAHQVADRKDVVVVVLDEAPPGLAASFPMAQAVAVAGQPDGHGRVPLVWLSREGQEVDVAEGVDLLKPLALGRGQSGRFKRST